MTAMTATTATTAITAITAAARERPAGRSAERGVSVVEMIVSIALLSVVSLIFYGSYVGALRAGQFLESHVDLGQYGQEVINALREEIVQSRGMYQEDGTGQDYRAALVFPAGSTVETDSRLPRIDVNGELRPDTGSETRVGNTLMLARQLAPVPVTVDLDGDGSPDPTPYLADRYRLQVVFLDHDTERSFAQRGYSLDLREGQSATFADAFQLLGLSPAVRQQVAQDLYAQGVRLAWDPARPVAAAFWSVAADGTVTGPNPAQTIPLTVRSLLPALRGGRISGAMDYSVGISGGAPLLTPEPVAVFGLPNGQFPGGFEVLAVGPAGARKVMLRLVLLSSYDGRIVARTSFVTATAIQM